MNEFMNTYWPALYRVMGPKIIDTWELWLLDVTNPIFSKVPFSKTFPK